jgi:hypothetical protein
MAMPTTTPNLALARCPHCFTANPTLNRHHVLTVQSAKGGLAAIGGPHHIQWHIYICTSCAGLVAAGALVQGNQVQNPPAIPAVKMVPQVTDLSADIPASAARYLNQARETLSSPSASVMTAASAVDAMLKERGYKAGKLFNRIKEAEQAGVLAKDMAQWAHDVRLDANDERHADLDASMLTQEDAARCLEFAEALADLLFVLPARVKRGLKPVALPAPA